MVKIGAYTQELPGYLQAGKLQLPVQTYPVADVQTVQRDLAARQTQGKMVLLFCIAAGAGKVPEAGQPDPFASLGRWVAPLGWGLVGRRPQVGFRLLSGRGWYFRLRYPSRLC